MSYKLKENMAPKIRCMYKNEYFTSNMELCPSYISQVIHRRRAVPKTVAYMFAKLVNERLIIEDIFDKVE